MNMTQSPLTNEPHDNGKDDKDRDTWTRMTTTTTSDTAAAGVTPSVLTYNWTDTLNMLPLSLSFVHFIQRNLQLDITGTHEVKARFFESILFLSIVLFITFVASLQT